MDYIVISTSSTSEKNFFLDLLKKMQKTATTLSADEIEEFGLMIAMKKAEESGEGNLENVKDLSKVTGG